MRLQTMNRWAKACVLAAVVELPLLVLFAKSSITSIISWYHFPAAYLAYVVLALIDPGPGRSAHFIELSGVFAFQVLLTTPLFFAILIFSEENESEGSCSLGRCAINRDRRRISMNNDRESRKGTTKTQNTDTQTRDATIGRTSNTERPALSPRRRFLRQFGVLASATLGASEFAPR